MRYFLKESIDNDLMVSCSGPRICDAPCSEKRRKTKSDMHNFVRVVIRGLKTAYTRGDSNRVLAVT